MIRYDALYAALGRAVVMAASPITPSVMWAPSEFPRDLQTTTAVVLTVLSHTPAFLPGRVSRDLITSCAIAPNAESQQVTLLANALRFRIPQTGTIANRVVEINEALTSGAYPLSITATVTPTELGVSAPLGLVGLQLSGAALEDVETSPFTIVNSSHTIDARIECYSVNRFAIDGAQNLLARILTNLHLEGPTEVMQDGGVGLVGVGPTIPLDGLAGPRFESRVACDLQLRMQAVATEPVLPVTSIHAGVTFPANPPTLSIEVEE